MFSGKSEELMRRLRRVGYARKSAILVKPAIDDRYSVDEVVSHEGQRMAARVVRTPEAILQLAAGCDVVGVDEGQFLDDSLIDVCEELIARGIRVVIAGLDLDYRREPFGPMPRLLAMADEVAKLKAVCHSLRRGGDVHAAPRRRHARALQRRDGRDRRSRLVRGPLPRLLPARLGRSLPLASRGKRSVSLSVVVRA